MHSKMYFNLVLFFIFVSTTVGLSDLEYYLQKGQISIDLIKKYNLELKHLIDTLQKTSIDISLNEKAKNTKSTTMSKFKIGFFNSQRGPMMYKRPRDTSAKTKKQFKTSIATGVPSTSETIVKIMFDNENECLITNNNRPCVCYMVDFIDMLDLSTDETMVDPRKSTIPKCPTYRAVPTEFVISPPMESKTTTVKVPDQNTAMDKIDKYTEIDFEGVLKYRYDQSTGNQNAVHFGLVGSDMKIQCSKNSTGINSYRWDYAKNKHKTRTDSVVLGTDTSVLTIIDFKPTDTKNYTCTTKTNPKHKTVYNHYLIAVERSSYEIRAKVLYDSNGKQCSEKLINSVRYQMPGLIQSVICPEGSLEFVCNVLVKSIYCNIENKLEVTYSVTLNDDSGYFKSIRSSKNGQNVLRYQQILAKVFSVLADNLKKTLPVKILSKVSYIDSHFEPFVEHNEIKKFVTCPPGFGIRDIFCGGCPAHQYSPDKSTECFKCPKYYHQPIAGSKECVECPHFLVEGCFMIEYVYYAVGTILFLGLFLIGIIWLIFRCKGEENPLKNKSIVRKIKKLRNGKKNRKSELPLFHSSSEYDSDNSVIKKIFGKFKRNIKLKKKPQEQILDKEITLQNRNERSEVSDENSKSIQASVVDKLIKIMKVNEKFEEQISDTIPSFPDSRSEIDHSEDINVSITSNVLQKGVNKLKKYLKNDKTPKNTLNNRNIPFTQLHEKIEKMIMP